MAAPERFAKKSDFSLAPRAPSIHGPNRRFVAAQQNARNGGRSRRSEDAAGTPYLTRQDLIHAPYAMT
jgi:hypothetical protein